MATTPSPRHPFDDVMWRPWLGLSYLVFLFLPLAFWRGWGAATAWASVAAALVFVPLFLAFHRRRGARAWPWIAATAALGYGLLPLNPGGNTFVIYAIAMLGATQPPRRAILVSALLWAALAALYQLTLPDPLLAATYGAMVAVIAVMVLAPVLYGRLRARRDAELRLSQEEVARLAAMAERERIGRDLHDLLGHTLSLIALKSELAGKLLERDPGAARAQIGEVESVARQALSQVREAVVGIRATGLQVELAAARLALLSAEVRLDQRLAPVDLPAPVEQALALCLREAVTNILRHAGASRVEVELQAGEGEARLLVSDDGRGGAGGQGDGHGLAGMRERLAEVGARLDVDSPPGAGTRLVVTIPRRALEASA